VRPWSRRRFLGTAAGLLLGGRFPAVTAADVSGSSGDAGETTLFLCGDVMTGRGIDQILPHPCDPRLYEAAMTSAAGYVELAERTNGPIQQPAAFSYPWGDALEALEHFRPDHRIINLETSVTRSADALPKGINYRMSPENFPVITAAGIDCCTLANNHVLDWGEAGLIETLNIVQAAGIAVAGAGRNSEEVRRPAVLDNGARGRVLVFAFGCASSGVPAAWSAGVGNAGVNYLPECSRQAALRIAEEVQKEKRDGDIIVVSVHWGGNWGYDVPAGQREFARVLIEANAADIVHGHSSHHPKAMEVHRGRLILYGCGDFLNDYEGIRGYEAYRDDLVLMYLPRLDSRDGRLLGLEMVPFRIRNFRLNHARTEDAQWLSATLDRECRRFGGRIEPAGDGMLAFHWD